ncbi:arginine repressor [Hathewaya histolytica]|uniref:Arginine repressor n=1 Tax=Hathewaya histolytica TaxID=1498 RepID=A0A4U9R9F1_HATHI|nr:arginine repressor [Hathewaya histolytica]VTQ88224.1 arginine repressor [Hathewaya histolytica]
MKSKRQSLILEIINSIDIETQEDLAGELEKRGIFVKQSTLSRDIKDLRLTKVLSKNKRYKYASISRKENQESERMMRILENTLYNVEKVDKIVVIKTLSGAAAGAAEAIDSLEFEGIAGTIAGDNTIFILFRQEEKAEEVLQSLFKIINH